MALVAAQTTDGGRSELPGMRKDMFDQIKDSKNKGGTRCRRFTNSKFYMSSIGGKRWRKETRYTGIKLVFVESQQHITSTEHQ